MRASAVSLEVREASVFYSANRVLDCVSLARPAASALRFSAHLACGKTTLLRAICGFVLHRGKLLQHAERRQPRRQRVQASRQRDVQAIRQEGNEDLGSHCELGSDRSLSRRQGSRDEGWDLAHE